jgi:hypothetical protein
MEQVQIGFNLVYTTEMDPYGIEFSIEDLVFSTTKLTK